MTRLLASSRFRRRAAWFAAAAAVAGGVVFVGFHFSNTGRAVPESFRPGKAQVVAPAPKPDAFTAAERRQVRAVAARFIETAVFRKDVDASWGLTTAGLRQGIARTEWAKGDIPIVPYPADAVGVVRWRLDYSFANDVALKVAVYPKPASGVDRQVFEIELENHGTAAKPRWLVSYWAPSGGAQISNAGPGGPPIDIATDRGRLGAAWLLAPIGAIVGGLAGLVGFLVLRGRVRHARARRLYTSRSSPS